MRSIRTRLLAMTLLTAVCTTFLVTVVLAVLYYSQSEGERGSGAVLTVALAWYAQTTSSELGARTQGYVIGLNERIEYVYNDADPLCSHGSLATDCIANLATIPEEGRRVWRNGAMWYEYQAKLPDGYKIIARHHQHRLEALVNTLTLGGSLVMLTAGGAIPIAALFAHFTIRPITRRLQRIANASRWFAKGDLDARTEETADDEIGQLGQQFDHMAATIGRQIFELRSLIAENNRLSIIAAQHARTSERATFARDLHDTISQHLFSLAMGTSTLGASIQRDPAQAIQHADQLAAIATQAQDELRSILVLLRPSALAERTLIESLTDHTRAWQARFHVDVQLRFQLGAIPVPLAVEEAMFRVCQESLNNVARHARAKHVTLVLAQDTESLWLRITDDGDGFDPASDTNGVGLIGMRERVRAFGGTLTLTSTHGGGTTVEARVPIAYFEGVGYANHAPTH